MNHATATDDAIVWLQSILEDGPVLKSVIRKTSPFPSTTLKRAADQLEIISRPISQYPRRTIWELPK